MRQNRAERHVREAQDQLIMAAAAMEEAARAFARAAAAAEELRVSADAFRQTHDRSGAERSMSDLLYAARNAGADSERLTSWADALGTN